MGVANIIFNLQIIVGDQDALQLVLSLTIEELLLTCAQPTPCRMAMIEDFTATNTYAYCADAVSPRTTVWSSTESDDGCETAYSC